MGRRPTVGSLFSGAGLGDLGLEWAGFEHKWFCENDPYCQKVLAKRWPGVPIHGDITNFPWHKNKQPIPKEGTVEADLRVDMICGGFP